MTGEPGTLLMFLLFFAGGMVTQALSDGKGLNGCACCLEPCAGVYCRPCQRANCGTRRIGSECKAKK